MSDTLSTLTLGILGGGQLGRMTALAGIRMGVRVKLLAPDASGPEAAFSDTTIGDWKDPEVLKAFAQGCDAITVESEWAPVEALLDAIGDTIPVFPSLDTVRAIRHKGRQKVALRDAGLPVPAFVNANSLDDAKAAAKDFGYPILLKRFEGSYDGYGNATCKDEADLVSAWSDLAADDGAMVEAWVPFEEELAILIARRPNGDAVTYPLVHTEQRDHRCHAVTVPLEIPEGVENEARRIGEAAVNVVDGVGITAVEMFRLSNGELLINELAPRPHNTGHYSIEACHTSQFENHLRGVLDLPLGSPDLRVPAACMINILGHRSEETDNRAIVAGLSEPAAAIHLYDKTIVRSRRKMGHVTVTADSVDDARQRAEAAAASIHL